MKTIGIDISVLNDAQRTGIGVYTYHLIEALLKINKTDRFILFGIATFTTYSYLKDLPFKNYPNVEMKIFKLPARSFRLVFLAWQKLDFPKIENLIGKVDIFHSFNWFMPPQACGKKVSTIFDLTSILYPNWHIRKTSQLDWIRFKKIAHEADLIIAISKNSQTDFLKLKPKSKIEVVYPAVSNQLKIRNSQANITQVLKKYSLEPNYYLSVSTIEPRKNLENLILDYLKSDLKDPLVLVGRMGWKSEKVGELMKQNYPRIQHLGFVDSEDLPILYQQAKCLIYPSYYEGFGIPVLEAMQLGISVICSNTSSLPEVGGKAVYYIDPYKKGEIHQALIVLAQNTKLRKSLKEKGLIQAKKFSWEKSAQKLNSLYQQLLRH